jgi:YbbR domain-containing protein
LRSEKKMVKITLAEDTIERIDALRVELEKEMGYSYTREELIDKALTALEDVRNG